MDPEYFKAFGEAYCLSESNINIIHKAQNLKPSSPEKLKPVVQKANSLLVKRGFFSFILEASCQQCGKDITYLVSSHKSPIPNSIECPYEGCESQVKIHPLGEPNRKLFKEAICEATEKWPDRYFTVFDGGRGLWIKDKHIESCVAFLTRMMGLKKTQRSHIKNILKAESVYCIKGKGIALDLGSFGREQLSDKAIRWKVKPWHRRESIHRNKVEEFLFNFLEANNKYEGRWGIKDNKIWFRKVDINSIFSNFKKYLYQHKTHEKQFAGYCRDALERVLNQSSYQFVRNSEDEVYFTRSFRLWKNKDDYNTKNWITGHFWATESFNNAIRSVNNVHWKWLDERSHISPVLCKDHHRIAIGIHALKRFKQRSDDNYSDQEALQHMCKKITKSTVNEGSKHWKEGEFCYYRDANDDSWRFVIRDDYLVTCYPKGNEDEDVETRNKVAIA